MSVTDYSKTASSNTAISGTDISEGCSPAGINNAIRQVMADVAEVVDATTALTALAVDNIKVDGNTISSTDTNGDITLDPNGTGDTIISSGNLGIGTSSPDTPLEVKHSSTDDALKISGNANSIAPYLSFENQEGGTAYVRGRIRGASNGVNGGLIFQTGSSGSMSERMRIDSSGNLLVGKTTSVGGSSVTGIDIRPNGILNIARDGANLLYLNRKTSNGDVAIFRKDNTNVGSITVTASSTSFNTSSDHRLKENAVDMTGAITRVKQLQPKRFNFIADDTDTLVDGFMAHEAQAVVPEAVTGTHNEVDDDGNAVMQGIDQSKLVPLLTGALKEAITKIETLETEMTALKARVTTLENA